MFQCIHCRTHITQDDEEILHELSGDYQVEFDATLEALVDRVVNGDAAPVDRRPFASSGRRPRGSASSRTSGDRYSERSSMSDGSGGGAVVHAEMKTEDTLDRARSFAQGKLTRSSNMMSEWKMDERAELGRRANAGWTALHDMVMRKDLRRVKSLLASRKAAVTIDACDSNQQTALHLAARQNAVAITATLLQCGADVNALDTVCNTPLLLANGVEVVKLLCSNGADVCVRNASGLTALHLAVMRRDADTVQVLLDHGCQLSVRAKGNGFTPLHYAVGMGEIAIVNMLLSRFKAPAAELAVGCVDGNTVLHTAAIAKYFPSTLEIIRVLLEHGARVEQTNNDDWTPLHLAAANASFRAANASCVVMQILLASSVSPHLPSPDGCTPAHLAAKYEDWDLLSLLLEHGADLNRMWRSGQSKLGDCTVMELIPASKRPEILPKITARQTSVSEASASRCMECDAQFSLLLWKSQCAVCRRVLCSKCAPDQVSVDQLPPAIAAAVKKSTATVCAFCKPSEDEAGPADLESAVQSRECAI